VIFAAGEFTEICRDLAEVQGLTVRLMDRFEFAEVLLGAGIGEFSEQASTHSSTLHISLANIVGSSLHFVPLIIQSR